MIGCAKGDGLSRIVCMAIMLIFLSGACVLSLDAGADFHCPACSHAFAEDIVKSDEVFDVFLHEQVVGISFPEPVYKCPQCGFAMSGELFWDIEIPREQKLQFAQWARKFLESPEIEPLTGTAPTYFLFGKILEYSDAIAGDGEEKMPPYFLAMVYVTAARQAEGRPVYGKIAEKNPEFVRRSLEESVRCLEAQRQNGGVSAEDIQALCLLVDANRRLGNFSEAAERLKEVRALAEAYAGDGEVRGGDYFNTTGSLRMADRENALLRESDSRTVVDISAFMQPE